MADNFNPSYDRQLIMDRRRAMIAELIVKRPGITMRQIEAWLGTLVEKKNEFGEVIGAAPRLMNPETEKPFSLTTVKDDIDYIREQWRKATAQASSEWLAQQLAALSEAEAIAWRKGNTAEVRNIWTQRNKILGLDAPIKIAKTDAKGEDVQEPDVITIFVYDDAAAAAGKKPAADPDADEQDESE